MPPRESSPQRTVLAAIQSGTFAPVYYLHGDDDYLKDVAINDLLNAALDPASRDFNCDVRRATELDAEAVNDVLGTPPMLAERRAVVIRDVGALKKAARAQLDKYLQRPATDTLLLLTSPNGAKTDAAIEKQTVALKFEPLSPERVRKWIAHHAQTALRMAVADDAIQLMQQAVGNDLQLLAGELDKCASYMLGLHDDATTIDIDAVSAVVGVRRGETVADLLDAVARHDAAAAVHLLPHVLSQPKMSGVVIVMMLSTQTFALAHGRARREAGVATSHFHALSSNQYFDDGFGTTSFVVAHDLPRAFTATRMRSAVSTRRKRADNRVGRRLGSRRTRSYAIERWRRCEIACLAGFTD